MASNYRVGDIGARIQRQIVDDATGVPLDCSKATLMEFRMQRPDASSLVVTPTYVNQGTDGLLQYLTLTGNLNQIGTWQLQIHVTLDSNHDFYTDADRFVVEPTI